MRNVVRLITLIAIVVVAQLMSGLTQSLTGVHEFGQNVANGVSLLGGIVYSKLLL